MPTAVIMSGIPGSGKSTAVEKFKEEYSATIICPDDIRKELTGDMSDQSRNQDVFNLAYQRLDEAVSKGENVIWDATNVSPFARGRVLDHIPPAYEKIAAYADVSMETALQRNAQRKRHVPEEVIQRMWGNFSKPETKEGFTEVIDVAKDPRFIRKEEQKTVQKNVLWFSRHEMAQDQKDALATRLEKDGFALGNIEQVSKTIRSAYDLQDEIKRNDVVAIVAPIQTQQQFVKLAGDKPVISAVSDRIVEKQPDGQESKVTFAFNRWEQIKNVNVQTHTFADRDTLEKEPASPAKNKLNVLWVSRHTMTPDQEKALTLADVPGKGDNHELSITQVDRTLKNAYEIQDEIQKADVVALVAPINIQQQALKIAGDKPVVTALSNREMQPDGTPKFVFNRWDQVDSISIDKEVFATKDDALEYQKGRELDANDQSLEADKQQQSQGFLGFLNSGAEHIDDPIVREDTDNMEQRMHDTNSSFVNGDPTHDHDMQQGEQDKNTDDYSWDD